MRQRKTVSKASSQTPAEKRKSSDVQDDDRDKQEGLRFPQKSFYQQFPEIFSPPQIKSFVFMKLVYDESLTRSDPKSKGKTLAKGFTPQELKQLKQFEKMVTMVRNLDQDCFVRDQLEGWDFTFETLPFSVGPTCSETVETLQGAAATASGQKLKQALQLEIMKMVKAVSKMKKAEESVSATFNHAQGGQIIKGGAYSVPVQNFRKMKFADIAKIGLFNKVKTVYPVYNLANKKFDLHAQALPEHNGWTDSRQASIFTKHFNPCLACCKIFQKQEQKFNNDDQSTMKAPQGNKKTAGYFSNYRWTTVCHNCMIVFSHCHSQLQKYGEIKDLLPDPKTCKEIDPPQGFDLFSRQQQYANYLKRIQEVLVGGARIGEAGSVLFRIDISNSKAAVFTWRILLGKYINTGSGMNHSIALFPQIHSNSQGFKWGTLNQAHLKEFSCLTDGQPDTFARDFFKINYYEPQVSFSVNSVEGALERWSNYYLQSLIAAERVATKPEDAFMPVNTGDYREMD